MAKGEQTENRKDDEGAADLSPLEKLLGAMAQRMDNTDVQVANLIAMQNKTTATLNEFIQAQKLPKQGEADVDKYLDKFLQIVKAVAPIAEPFLKMFSGEPSETAQRMGMFDEEMMAGYKKSVMHRFTWMDRMEEAQFKKLDLENQRMEREMRFGEE